MWHQLELTCRAGCDPPEILIDAMLLSVIIPTYSRSDILKKCLKALFHQTLPKKDYEIIVVDDGSKDQTKATVKQFQKKYSNLYYLYQKNQGQGIARNIGLKKATGDVVVFIGDDIIAVQDFLSEHLRFHLRFSKENEAVLGLTLWHPKIHVNDFMRWMTNGSSIFGRFGGHQFAYEKLEGKKEADFNFFYTSNISLKRALLEKYPFDPDFSRYGWEDIELGYRLYLREGLRIYYNPAALGYHDHMMDEEVLVHRMRSIGASARMIHHRYPELKKVPPAWKYLIFWLLGTPPALFFAKLFHRNLYYYALSKKYFLEGLKMNNE